MMVVVAELGVVIIAVPGLPACGDHMPPAAGVAAMVAVPPGKVAQFTFCAGPALGWAATVTVVVEVQAPTVQIKV